jgi:hypothetical protein
VPDSVGDQDTLYAALDRLAPKRDSDRAQHGDDDDDIGWHERDYVAALSAGDLHGTNPTDAATRLAALMSAVWDLQYPPTAQPVRPLRTVNSRRKAGQRGGAAQAEPISGGIRG